jgi:hypothetical protein
MKKLRDLLRTIICALQILTRSQCACGSGRGVVRANATSVGTSRAASLLGAFAKRGRQGIHRVCHGTFATRGRQNICQDPLLPAVY